MKILTNVVLLCQKCESKKCTHLTGRRWNGRTFVGWTIVSSMVKGSRFWIQYLVAFWTVINLLCWWLSFGTVLYPNRWIIQVLTVGRLLCRSLSLLYSDLWTGYRNLGRGHEQMNRNYGQWWRIPRGFSIGNSELITRLLNSPLITFTIERFRTAGCFIPFVRTRLARQPSTGAICCACGYRKFYSICQTWRL